MSLNCINQQYSLSLRLVFYYIRNQFNMSQLEQYIIFSLTPFVFLAGFINIVFFMKGKKRTQPPADILFFISIFGMFRISSYLAASIYDLEYPPATNFPPPDYAKLCDGTGFINVMCQLADFFYTVVFCIYYVIKIKNPLKSWIRDNKEVHIVCILLIIVGTLIFYLTDLIGISILGVCGYKIGPGIIVIDIVFTGSYFIVMMVSSTFFVKYLKSISKLQDDSQMYFSYYFKYLIISSIVYLVGVITLFVITIKCINNQSDESAEILTIICNVSRILSPIMVFVVMLNHPELSLASFLKYINSKCNKKSSAIQTSAFYQDLMTTNRVSFTIQLNSLNKNQWERTDYISKLKDRSKACLINTILGCISLQQIQFLQDFDFNKGLSKSGRQTTSFRLSNSQNRLFPSEYSEIYGWNYLQKYEFELNDEVVSTYSQIFSRKLPTINLKFVSFSPTVFKIIQKKQNIFNLYQKMLPLKNQHNILENVSTDGGRSGQFFFFNYDKTIIMKTITITELNVFRNRLEAYYHYFIKNPLSFIVRILGLYKVLNPETQEQINFMLMGNILKKIPKDYIIKSYDMKGSTYQRQVLSKEQMKNFESISTHKTLKDMDFYVIQGKVHISKQDSDQIKKTIEEDISFLCSEQLIDYSLIVLKIDYKRFLQSEDLNTQDLKLYFSSKQSGVAYVFGIIDYLQTWNIRKKGQKWYKSIFNKKEAISSQDPQFYAKRFMKNLVMMILP